MRILINKIWKKFKNFKIYLWRWKKKEICGSVNMNKQLIN